MDEHGTHADDEDTADQEGVYPVLEEQSVHGVGEVTARHEDHQPAVGTLRISEVVDG